MPWDGIRYPVVFTVSSEPDPGAMVAVGGGPIERIDIGGTFVYNPVDESSHVPSGKSVTSNVERTSACTTASGNTLYLIVSTNSATGTDVGQFFEEVGCVRGMEFDGGGSTTMVYRGEQVRLSSDIPIREIGEGLLIHYFRP